MVIPLKRNLNSIIKTAMHSLCSSFELQGSSVLYSPFWDDIYVSPTELRLILKCIICSHSRSAPSLPSACSFAAAPQYLLSQHNPIPNKRLQSERKSPCCCKCELSHAQPRSQPGQATGSQTSHSLSLSEVSEREFPFSPQS